MNFTTGDLVTHYLVSGLWVTYRFARVHSVGENGLVLKDCKTDAPFGVAFDPTTTHQDFRITVERQLNEAGTRKRAVELWKLNNYLCLRLKIDKLIKDMSSEIGLETTYPDPFYETGPSPFRDYWLKELGKTPTEPEIENATGTPVTDSLRPSAAQKR